MRLVSPATLIALYAVRMVCILTLIFSMPKEHVASNLKIYDDYGDETDLIHFGATIEVVCPCHVPCNVAEVRLHFNGKQISVTKYESLHTVKFRLRVDNDFQLGEYQCQTSLNNVSWPPVLVEYRLCNDFDTSCLESDYCAGKFCILRRTGLSICSVLKGSECAVHRARGLRACVRTGGMFGSVCDAYIANSTTIMAFKSISGVCREEQLIAFQTEAGQDIAFGSISLLNEHTKIRLWCSKSSRYTQFEVQEKMIGSKTLLWTTRLKCHDYVPFHKYGIEQRMLGSKTKLTATTTNDQVFIQKIIYLVFLAEPILTFSLSNGTECDKNTTDPRFDCVIQNYNDYHLKVLRISIKIMHMIVGDLNSTVGELSLSNLPLREAGKYICRAEVTYRTCSPFSEVKVYSVVESYLDKSCLPESAGSGFVIIVKEDPSGKLILKGVIGIFSFILLVILVTVVIVFHKRRMRLKREKLRNPELEKTLIESDPKNRKLILDEKTLFALSQHLTVSTDDYENAKEYVEENLGPRQPDPKTSRKDAEGKTQYVDIPCYVHAKVVTMNVSRTIDWKMRPLIIAVLPRPPDFARFWELIVSNKIGTVLWIGDFAAGTKTLIDAYICRMANSSREFNEQRFCLMIRIRTVSVLKFDKYAIYTIKFQVKKGSMKTYGLVTLIHVQIWPANAVPPFSASIQITELCSIIETQQQKRGEKWPGVLIHDSCSVERSAAMAALFICRQIYVERRRVNFLAVLKYIRAARLGCFHVRGHGHVQVAVVATCLAALAKSIKEESTAEQKSSNSKSKSDNSVFSNSKKSQNLSGRAAGTSKLKKSSSYVAASASRNPSAALTTGTTLLASTRKQSTSPSVSKLTEGSTTPSKSKETQSTSKPSSGSQDVSVDAW